MNADKTYIPSAQTWIDRYLRENSSRGSSQSGKGLSKVDDAPTLLPNVPKHGEDPPINMVSPAEQSVQMAASEVLREKPIKGRSKRKYVKRRRNRRRGRIGVKKQKKVHKKKTRLPKTGKRRRRRRSNIRDIFHRE